MAMDSRLDRRMQQGQALSQQARVTVHILQMPMLGLREYLKQEVSENPMLEESQDVEKNVSEDIEQFEPTESWDNSLKHPGDYDPEDDKKKNYRESLITKPETLEDHLLWQLDMFSPNENDRKIGEYIIGSLNADGYLKATVEEISTSCNAGAAQVESVLALVQTFEPTGVAARDIRECLLIQLKAHGKDETLIYKIVEDCLEDLEKKDYQAISRKLGIKLDEEERARELSDISALDPNPGKAYASGTISYVIPDITFKVDGENKVIELNNAYIPVLVVSKFYSGLLKKKDTDDETKSYLQKKRERADWIINAILQRQDTIKKIATYLVNYQKDFFEEASGEIRPLKMTEVAKDLSISESTVSRAVAGKYIQTDVGTFALKYFFSTALHQSKGADISASAIKGRIASIIKEEDTKKPLSDQKIVDILLKEDIAVSRRTVAKYRESMKILPAKLRHR